jgi:glutathione synthase/RimK-type ligase-like ATP-grasp enzyme
MTRYGNTFINNISKGALCKKESLDPKIINLALKTSELLNMSFCGVDIMHYEKNIMSLRLIAFLLGAVYRM